MYFEHCIGKVVNDNNQIEKALLEQISVADNSANYP